MVTSIAALIVGPLRSNYEGENFVIVKRGPFTEQSGELFAALDLLGNAHSLAARNF